MWYGDTVNTLWVCLAVPGLMYFSAVSTAAVKTQGQEEEKRAAR